MARRKDKQADEPEEVVEYDLDAVEAELDAREAAQGGGASEETEKLTRDRDDWRDKAQRALADFQNFQRRAANNEREARATGVRVVVEDVLRVLDQFDLALAQDPEKVKPDQIIQGLKVTRDELFRACERRGVKPIDPKPGDEFEPGKHEAVMQQPAEGVAPGCVAMLLQIGYAMDERVIRAARVAVTPCEEPEENEDGGGD